MAADLGCSMETIMAHYMSNHIAVAYGDIFGEMVALSPVARLQGSDHVVPARGGLSRSYLREPVSHDSRIICRAGSIRFGSAGSSNELAMPDRNPGDRLCAGRARC